jgi:hypothetical protein
MLGSRDIRVIEPRNGGSQPLPLRVHPVEHRSEILRHHRRQDPPRPRDHRTDPRRPQGLRPRPPAVGTIRCQCRVVGAGGDGVQRASSSCWPGVVLPGLVVVAIAARYKGYRYPIEIIGHAVWLYHRFALSLRDVEELMLARGVVVTYETIRSWCAKFGPTPPRRQMAPR